MPQKKISSIVLLKPIKGGGWAVKEGAKEVILINDVFNRVHEAWLNSDKVQKSFVAHFCEHFVGFVRSDLKWLVGKFASLDTCPGKPPTSILKARD